MHAQAEHAELLAQVTAWEQIDPDPETRAELAELVSTGDFAELSERFAGRLSFGTAGLRAELGAGPGRMNRVVVMQTTAALAQFLLRRAAAGKTQSKPPTVVIGFDGRKNSEVFATDAARVLAGYGLDAALLPGPLPTPVTAFAVRHLGAAAGIMITASHNPPRDNGYKLYLGDADNGSQIIPPADTEIAAEIEKVAKDSFHRIKISDDYRTVSDFIVTSYVAATLKSARGYETHLLSDTAHERPHPKIVYTAMHGVGAAVTWRLFTAANLPLPEPVVEQHTPDGSFPTVSFPNPEEPGALDLAFARAAAVGADLIIAHDPDADRLAVALPAPDGTGFQALTGNQLGLLLGMQAARRARAALDAGQRAKDAPHPTLACTIVSSPALSAVAEHYGLGYAETLSGFKWVSRVPGLCFGFEEALGYLVNPDTVSDKDGISAALAITDLASELHTKGETLWSELERATGLFGYFASSQVTVRLNSAAAVLELAERLRDKPPTAFAGSRVARYTDLQQATEAHMRANVLRFDLADGSRVMVRPSGTEPKLKLYIDCRSTEGTAHERKQAAESRVRELEAEIRTLVQTLQGA